MDMMNPANPLSPLNPLNPANPMNLVNPASPWCYSIGTCAPSTQTQQEVQQPQPRPAKPGEITVGDAFLFFVVCFVLIFSGMLLWEHWKNR